MNILENLSEAQNKVAKTYNKVVPQIVALHEREPITALKTGGLSKKSEKALAEITGPHHNKARLQCFAYRTYGHTVVMVKASYQTCEYSCNYVEKCFYLGSTFEKLPKTTVKQLQKAQVTLDATSNKICELETKRNKLKRLLNY